jgi:hypothetical protein
MTPERVRRVAGLVFACAVASLFTLYFTGFCFTQARYIGDAEFLERAVRYTAPTIRDMPGGSSASREDIKAYLKNNPTCCRVEGSDFFLSSSPMDKLFGLTTTWVRILHPLTDEQIALVPNAGAYSETYVALDRCGNFIRRTGQRLTESEARKL